MTCKRCHRVARYRGLCDVHFKAVGHHGFVPAQPTRDRIALLRSRGHSLRTLADRTGLTMPTLLCQYDKVQRATEQAVFAVPIPKLGGPGWIDATGARRRIQALGVIGWSQRELATRTGIMHQHLNRIGTGRIRTITGDTAATIAAVYDELWNRPGPTNRSRADAARKGWLPPLAWDDDTIDDPKAQPDLGERARVTFAERYEELRRLGERNEEAIAKRLWNSHRQAFGISPESVSDMCNRFGLERPRDVVEGFGPQERAS